MVKEVLMSTTDLKTFKVGKTACYHPIITNIPSWNGITREEQHTVEKEGGS